MALYPQEISTIAKTIILMLKHIEHLFMYYFVSFPATAMTQTNCGTRHSRKVRRVLVWAVEGVCEDLKRKLPYSDIICTSPESDEKLFCVCERWLCLWERSRGEDWNTLKTVVSFSSMGDLQTARWPLGSALVDVRTQFALYDFLHTAPKCQTNCGVCISLYICHLWGLRIKRCHCTNIGNKCDNLKKMYRICIKSRH